MEAVTEVATRGSGNAIGHNHAGAAIPGDEGVVPAIVAELERGVERPRQAQGVVGGAGLVVHNHVPFVVGRHRGIQQVVRGKCHLPQVDLGIGRAFHSIQEHVPVVAIQTYDGDMRPARADEELMR